MQNLDPNGLRFDGRIDRWKSDFTGGCDYCRAKNACSLDCGLEMTMIVDHLELDWRYVV